MRLRKCAMKRDEIIASGGAHCDAGFILGILGISFAVLGAISDAMNTILILEPTSWLLLAVVTCLIALASFIAWALAVLLDAMEVKGEKQSSD
ncbi:MAG: hypothetical protein JSW14_07260 [Candidatus Bathyarchaeum sp.]|nr:MAG: hypothetical protein JSW14_07260 [Candidatus Bathyarchaeum sp.]